jgi:3-oxosteroid 1-dehydrogenase
MFHETVPLRWRGRTWPSRLAYLKVGLRIIRNRLGARLVGMGAALYARMLELAIAREIELWADTETLRLIEENGRVIGAEVQRHGRSIIIAAGCGVLLNTGGFSLNREMRERHQPSPASTEWSLANPGDTGEMIQIAQGLGAALDLMDASWWVPGTTLPGGIRMYLVPELQQPHGFVVDSSGRRYMNEATSYVAIGRAMYEREKTVPAVPSWLIMDRRYMEKYLIVGQSMRKIPQSWLDAGVLVQAENLEALGQRCGLPAGSLTATAERFNGFARAGRDDDFGRGISAYNRLFGDPLHRPTPGLGTVERPPYYAMPVYPNDVGTCGGLVTDEHARALRDDGSVIEGLYATGNCTATVMGHSYPGAGASIAPSLIFGYIAAEHATMSA